MQPLSSPAQQAHALAAGALTATFGLDYHSWQRGQKIEVVWDSSSLQSGHSLFIGRSGAGKTTQLKKFLSALSRQSSHARMHLLDVHDDLDLPGASEVEFDQSSEYGLNPLRVNADRKHGGVYRCIDVFMKTVQKVSGNLGPRQQALLRNILLDIYKMRGFDARDPDTWAVDESQAHLLSDGSDGRLYLDIPFAEKEEAKSVARITFERNIRLPGRNGVWWIAPEDYAGAITRWLPLYVGRTHPTLDDVIAFTRRQLMISFKGSDQAGVTAFEAFQKTAQAYAKLELNQIKNGGTNKPDGLDDGASARERAAGKAIEAYANYLSKTRTGDELEDIIKYRKAENLESIIDRLETLATYGVFRGAQPDFDPRASIWRYRIGSLAKPVLRLFVLFRLQELFYAAVQRGITNVIRDIIVVDEVHQFVDEDGEDILSTLAREARKFGVMVVAANQDPELPKAFIGSLSTKVILGIDNQYHGQARTKMGMRDDLIGWIKPKFTMAVQMQDASDFSGQWRGVLLRTPNSPPGQAVGRPVAAVAAR